MAKVKKEVGFIAYRDPVTRDFLPARPIYAEMEEEVSAAAENAMVEDISKVFAENMRRYIDGGGLSGKCSDKKVKT